MTHVHRFETTHTGEPHARRRRGILAKHPEIRTLMGHDSKTAWITVGVVAAQLVLAWLVGRLASADSWLASGWVILPLSYLVGAVLTHWLAMTIHETTHNLAFRTRAANIALSLVANVSMVFPCAITFRRYHLHHHTHLGVAGEDTDLPHRAEVAWIGTSTARKLFWLAIYPFVYIGRGLTFAGRISRGEVLNWALIIPIDVAIYHWLGPPALVYLALSMFFAHGLHPVAAHFVHEHYVFSRGQETFSYYGPLNRVTFNVGFHNEHHDFMNIPGRRLPELRRMASESYSSLTSHRSWTKVLWLFITDRGIGPASRIVRSPEDFHRGAADGAA